jgi:hypothetical protein
MDDAVVGVHRHDCEAEETSVKFHREPDLDLIGDMDDAGVGVPEIYGYAAACLTRSELRVLARSLLALSRGKKAIEGR